MIKKLLIVRVDAIGDYILFRNFIKIIAQSNQYKDYKIDMLCDKSWFELSQYLDKKYIDNFFSFDIQRYISDSWYQMSLESRLNDRQYDVIVQPTYSRLFVVDRLIYNIKAKQKIGFDGDNSNISVEDKNRSDKYYSDLIQSPTAYLFEFERNKLFVEKLLNDTFEIKKTFIDFTASASLPSTYYVVLVVGASAENRKWSAANVAKIAKYLQLRGLEIVLCGGTTDLRDAYEFQSLFGQEYIDLVGKTSLVDMLGILKNAVLVLSNDTGLAHMSVALRTKTIVVSNLNHFSRFVPYPQEYENVFTISSYDYYQDFQEFREKYYEGSTLDIDEIDYRDVMSAIDTFLPFKDSKNMDRKMVDYINFTTLSKISSGIDFTQKLSYFIDFLDNLNEQYIIYGYGTIGKTIQKLMPEKIVAFVDQASDLIAKRIIKGEVYSPQNLRYMCYDKIIISALGREDEIENYLVHALDIPTNKIIRFAL